MTVLRNLPVYRVSNSGQVSSFTPDPCGRGSIIGHVTGRVGVGTMRGRESIRGLGSFTMSTDRSLYGRVTRFRPLLEDKTT